jgi:dTDP-4-dehydrorhamnose 3,5-epimerase-like enzyme
MNSEQPKLIDGGLAIDVRGMLSFVNDLENFVPKRFYIVQNYQQGYIRAFHGHQKESKLVFVLQGATQIKLILMEDYESKVEPLAVKNYTLSAGKPQVLYIPPGYYNGFRTLTEDTKVMFLSSSTLEESKSDDIRIAWNCPSASIWNIDYY